MQLVLPLSRPSLRLIAGVGSRHECRWQVLRWLFLARRRAVCSPQPSPGRWHHYNSNGEREKSAKPQNCCSPPPSPAHETRNPAWGYGCHPWAGTLEGFQVHSAGAGKIHSRHSSPKSQTLETLPHQLPHLVADLGTPVPPRRTPGPVHPSSMALLAKYITSNPLPGDTRSSPSHHTGHLTHFLLTCRGPSSTLTPSFLAQSCLHPTVPWGVPSNPLQNGPAWTGYKRRGVKQLT